MAHAIGPISIVKTHEKVILHSPFENLGPNYKPSDICTDTYVQNSSEGGEFHRFPALAVPAGETKTFVCPNSHIEVLKKELAKTDRILVIGWKAGDPHLLNLIKECVTQPTSLFIVSGSKDGVDKVMGKFKPYGKFSLMGQENGFSSFIHRDSCATFFGTTY